MDREKVIKQLENDAIATDTGYVEVPLWLFSEILALLKEQEAVESGTDSEGTWYCGNCGETIGFFPVGCSTPLKFCKFCPECGREVKWE